MRSVRIENIKHGMVLAKEVRGRLGRKILGVGSVITEKHIHIFRSWGITEIITHSDSTQEQMNHQSSEKLSVEDERIEKQLKHHFKFSDLEHPVMQELFQIVLNRKLYPESANTKQ